MESFNSKGVRSKEELKAQVEEIQKFLRVELNLQSFKDIFELSIREMKEKYHERYKIYVRIFQALKHKEKMNELELNKMRTWITALNNLNNYIINHDNMSEEERILRDRQRTVFEDIFNALEQGHLEGYVKLPTGVGKTVLFSQIVESMGLKTLIVVPSKILVKQTGKKLEQFTDSEFGEFYEHRKDLSKNITITTYSSFKKINPKDYDLLILDEAHRALGDQTQELIKEFDCPKIGFTATPDNINKSVSDLLSYEIHNMSITEAVKGGLISPFKALLAETDVDLSSVTIKSTGEYNEEELEKAVNIESRNLAAVNLYKQAFMGDSAIAYCSGVDHATDLAKLFNENGVKAEVISGDTSEVEKERILEAYKKGEIQLLCNAKILIEGFDEPRASVGLMLHPVKTSLIDVEQSAGRMLRIDPNNPNKCAYIVNFIDQNTRCITFAEVVGASEVVPDSEEITKRKKGSTSVKEKTKGSKKDFSGIKIKGLRVIVKTEEVMSISMDLKNQRELENKKIRILRESNLLELMKEVKEEGIVSSYQYKEEYSKYDWPTYTTIISWENFPRTKDGKPDWDTFFGREKKKKWTNENLEELMLQIREKGIVSSSQYKEEHSKYGWPIYQTITSWEKFPKTETGKHDLDTFFGREKKKWTNESLEELMLQIREKGIVSSSQYREEHSKYGWPTIETITSRENFPRTKDGKPDWDTFFGREKKKWTNESLEELKKEITKAGITGVGHYKSKSSKNNWPTIEKILKFEDFPKKEDGKPDWDKFFDRNKED